MENKRIQVRSGGHLPEEHAHHHHEEHTPHPPVKKIDDRKEESRRIISRLQAIIATHVEGANRMGHGLGMPDLIAVVEALQAEADQLDPQPHLMIDDEIAFYLRASLYEELLSEPSNIFYTTQVSPDVVRYDAVPTDFWKECLALLHGGFLKLSEKG